MLFKFQRRVGWKISDLVPFESYFSGFLMNGSMQISATQLTFFVPSRLIVDKKGWIVVSLLVVGEHCVIWAKTSEPNSVLDWTWGEAVDSKLPKNDSSAKVVLHPVTCSHTAGDAPSAPAAKPISILLERALQRGSKILPSAVKNRQKLFGGCLWEGVFAVPRNGRHVCSGRQRSRGSPLSPLTIVHNKHRCCTWM